MTLPSFKEDHISQIPALQLLVNLGYEYVPPELALAYRGGKRSNVIFESVLAGQLARLNEIGYRGERFAFSDANIASCVRALKDVSLHEGLLVANERVYDLLTLGTSREQAIDGDRKSYSLRYIDWERPENNLWQVTEELSVLRGGRYDTYRPDVVLYCNGIPLAVIECKRPDHKDPMGEAIAQQLRNQRSDGIRQLYVPAQLLLSLATNHGRYATVGTPPEFWSRWREQEPDEAALQRLVNTPLPAVAREALFAERYHYVSDYFDRLEADGRGVTEQDRYLYHLCRPERLLDLARNFTVFDNGLRKVARYQQYFAIRRTLRRIRQRGPERGGVIWHTQGSGKSLTMVMLATAILESGLRNPRIVIVTDRTNLDDQIYKTFTKCDVSVQQAGTGKHLVELLEAKSDAVVTTIINKFQAAVHRRKGDPFDNPNIFVLIDEGHRTQYGTFNVAMRQVFPNACFLAFTGTPLTKKEKNTTAKFGGIIDSYTVTQAVADGAVVPLVYEGRLANLEVDTRPLEAKFDRLTANLSTQQVEDFKRKYARAGQVDKAQQRIETIAADLTQHFITNWRDTPFKAQLVTADKNTAVRYYDALRTIPKGLRCALVISPPDMREGDTDAFEESDDRVRAFWRAMMDKYGSADKYQEGIVGDFVTEGGIELIIVVDKLLTGFDAPFNRTLYLTRPLREHKLLQAIARVNRVAPGKDYGLIVDYSGVLEDLHGALREFGDDFDPEDLSDSVTELSEMVADLPQKHSELWALFRDVRSRSDLQEYQELLADAPLRDRFYAHLSAYARRLQLALSSLEWHERTPDDRIKRYKDDLGFFSKLRLAVRGIYSDAVDYGDYERQIQKLIDQHVTSYEVEAITEPVPIFDTEAFAAEVERVVGTASKADLIASRTDRHITERMDDDPALYRRFSRMLQEAIEDYRARRISEAEYYARVDRLRAEVLNEHDGGTPVALREAPPAARAVYGQSLELFKNKDVPADRAREVATATGLSVDTLVREHVLDEGEPVVDWTRRGKITGPLLLAIDDYLYDVVQMEHGIRLSDADRDQLAAAFLKIAERRYA